MQKSTEHSYGASMIDEKHILEITDSCTIAILESINDVVFIHDAGTGEIRYLNSRIFDIYGYTPEEAKKLTIEQLSDGAPPFSLLEVQNHLLNTKINGPQKFDWLAKHKDGHTFWTEVSMRFSVLNNFDIIIATVRDISERKSLIQEIIDSEMRFHALNTASFGGIAIHDNGVILDCNQGLAEITGFSINELIGIDGMQLIAPEWREYISCMIKEGYDKTYDAEGLRKDGTKFEISIRGKNIPYGGKIVRVTEFRDITDQKKVEESLRASEERFRLMNENISDVIVETDIFGNYTYISPSFRKVCARGEEVIGKNAFELIHPDDVDLVKGEFLKGYNEGIDTRVEYRFFHPMKGYIWFESVGKPYINRHGKKIALIASRDITERKISEEMLREKEERFRLITDNISDAIVETDIDGIYLYVSPSYKHISGRGDEVIGETSTNKIHPDDIESARNAISSMVKTGKDTIIEYRYLHPVMGYFWVESHCKTYTTQAGEPRIVLSARDISERKKAEALLKESEASYRGLLDCVSEAIYILDENNRFIEVNEGAIQMYGLTREELVGKTPADVSAPGRNDLEKTALAIQEAFNGKPQQFEFWGIRKNGQIFPKDVRASKGTYFGKNIVIAVSFDITERKQTEIELIHAKEKAEEMSRIKSSFLANMSHELRTPLIGILGYSDLLKDSVQDPDERKMARTIFSSGERLLNTLNMILNLSKIEANKIDIIKTKINLYESTKESIKLFEPLAAKKNITIELIKPELNVLVYGDIYMIDSIVNNLINNAVKYTQQGTVSVEISRETIHHVAWSVIKITDTGIGIPEEAQKYIFDEFRQGSEGFGRAFEGSGLGLTVAKKYVDILGGEIKMESKIGAGSTFTVKLPADVQEEQGKQPDSKNNPGESTLPNILLVDDDLTTYGVVKYMTSKLCIISHAKNGTEAIDMIRQKKYAVVLLDINLGMGLSGFDVLKEIKVTPGYDAIPVVALTAYAMAGDRQRFLDAGCQYYLSKPFRKNDLLEQDRKSVV